jgi:TIR domain
MTKRHVFISYCRDNAAEVSLLRERLISEGEPVWWDQDIKGGEDWKFAIRSAMTNAYAVVLCLSFESQSRKTSGIYPEAPSVRADDSATGTRRLLLSTGTAPLGLAGSPPVLSASTSQRRKRLAFSPRDSATAAIDTPGCRHAAIASALNSALWRRRRRRPMLIACSLVFMCPPICGLTPECWTLDDYAGPN